MSKPIVKFIDEPLLEFANQQCEEHPKDGLYLYGPVKSVSETNALKFGVIGCTGGLSLFDRWSEVVKGYIPAHKENVAHHTGFPGFEAAFGLKWPDKPITSIHIPKEKVANSIRLINRHEAIKKTVDIYDKAISEYLLKEAEVTPDFWFVVIPDEVFLWGRPTKAPPVKDRIKGQATLSKKAAARLLREPSLFDSDNAEADLQKYDLNFRNQLKAMMLGKAVIQIVKERTLQSATTLDDVPYRTTQDPATLAWNLCTTSYYKSLGPPWRLKDIRKDVCYVGIVFKKDASDPAKGNACCGAQLFLSSGEGLVFRGAIGSWYSDSSKQLHLSQDKAKELMKMIISGYENIHGSPPKEVFIHGKTCFNKDEWNGFNEALPDGTNLVGIRIRATDKLKLYRLAMKPPARGTYMHVDDRMAYLWTTGYVARLNTYPGFETPNPLAVNIDWGEADLHTVVSDILALTKVNFNSCTFSDGQPVTLKFADAIGEILTAAPILMEAPQPFKYYI